jgi:uncharacterized Ntn-hydrolase superfamily protein
VKVAPRALLVPPLPLGEDRGEGTTMASRTYIFWDGVGAMVVSREKGEGAVSTQTVGFRTRGNGTLDDVTGGHGAGRGGVSASSRSP